jgi:tetratricopeptide (TPR) repeat protein
MAEYLFTANTQSGKELADRIEAESASAARTQLEAMGLHNIVVHTDDFAARMYGRNLVDPMVELDPALLIRMQKQGGKKNLLLEIIKGNGWLLLVLLGWNAYSLYGGELGMYDWIGFGATALLLLVIIVFSVPALLFESILQAQLWARWDDAMRSTSLLRIFGRSVRIGPHMLDYYQAKSLIGLGQEEEGMALFARHRGRANVPEMLWLSLHASLLDEAKRRDEAGEIMRQLTVQMPDSAQVWLDLALNRALYGDLETAKQAIAEAELRELSPIMACVVPFVRGEIALREGRCEEAVTQFSEVVLGLSPYLSQTALHPLFIGIEARYAVALARCGKLEAARQAWDIASPIMAAHGEQKYLDDWTAATSGRPAAA